MTEFKKKCRQAIGLMDLTRLNDDDTGQKVIQLCRNAHTPLGNTAAVCIYPRFIAVAKQTLKEQNTPDIKVATVTNFPYGKPDIEAVLQETRAAVKAGVDEVDVVFPWRELMAGRETAGAEMIKQCRKICRADIKLKVIIESGQLHKPELIRRASEIAIAKGADFIKTSTGKVAVNATLEAAEIMLTTIKNSQQEVGLKVAGGIKDAHAALQYMALAEKIMGSQWLNAQHFRLGASSLLDSLLAAVKGETGPGMSVRDTGDY